MAFREDLTNFPFYSKDRGVWYFVINWEDKSKKEFCNVQEKRDLIPFLNTIITRQTQNKHELYGVWNGQYSTDIFVIPIDVGLSELKKYFSL